MIAKDGMPFFPAEIMVLGQFARHNSPLILLIFNLSYVNEAEASNAVCFSPYAKANHFVKRIKPPILLIKSSSTEEILAKPSKVFERPKRSIRLLTTDKSTIDT
uniref:Uncharacterized protein n=1 Tax=Romanomermis culicivorax TaxID=13658 RepID=A0A915I9R4_ROMCU